MLHSKDRWAHMFSEPTATPILAPSELCSALRRLPLRLGKVGAIVAARDMTPRPFERDIGPPRGAPDPVSFTRLAGTRVTQDGRNPRRFDRGAPACASSPLGTKQGSRRQGPNSDVSWSRTSSKRGSSLARIATEQEWKGSQEPDKPGRPHASASGLPAFEAAAAWRNCSNSQLRFVPARCRVTSIVWWIGVTEILSRRIPLPATATSHVIGLRPTSAASVSSGREAASFRRCR